MMTTPKLKFTHAELTKAGFEWTGFNVCWQHRDGRRVNSLNGRDLNRPGQFYVDSLDDLVHSNRDADRLATIVRLTEERDRLLFACETFSQAWHSVDGNFDMLDVVCIEAAISVTDEAIAEVKGGAK